VPPLSTYKLADVTDSAGMPVLGKNVGQVPDRLLGEIDVYNDAVLNAHEYSSAAFAHSARQDVTYAHLWNEPKKYRGEVVHVEGRLKRVRRYDPSLMLRQAGVRDLYEGWIFADADGANPMCIVFTDLPEGIRVAEDMDLRVAFDGYFFKKYRYKAVDSGPHQAREAPLLVGHAPVLLRGAVASDSTPNWATSLLVVLFGLVVLTLVLAFGLYWWFQRSDSQVRNRIKDATQKDFVAPTEPINPVDPVS
jgi:hypothetical protein